MAEVRDNLFDSTIGASSERTWLDNKILRRELAEDIGREGLTKRAERATQAAEDFRDDLTRRAELRTGIEKKSAEIRRREEDLLRRKADEYRERLRRYLPSAGGRELAGEV